ncbi:hypothetical protein OCU04_001458 [Sclerotinia nivalis]|uniref:CENP-V/GFA domain-containing protein n=1 Tax=Sclerotinia nivalis TaxID=352851 RepID=A0A9X0DR39_9HELO|nr:hypothetical protein OCU04_001458 [Sclerotinia nivalis]
MADETATDKSMPYFPLAGGASDGWSKEDEATATCFCGAVQLAFPTQGPALVNTLICHCHDCRKITASMFSSIFIIADTHLKHIRGLENLKIFSQYHTVATKNTMSNHFCGTCGSLMYRVSSGYPGMSILRIGTVDDFHLHETRLRPKMEAFTNERVAWLKEVEGTKQFKDGVTQ